MFPVAETEFPTGIRPGGMGIPELPPAVKEVWLADACVLTSDYYAVAALLLAGCETGTSEITSLLSSSSSYSSSESTSALFFTSS